MKKPLVLMILAFVTILTATALSTNQTFAQRGGPPDKIKATKTVTGTFKGFEVGDYMHAVIVRSNGKEDSFFLGHAESLQYFLVSHKRQQLTITYQVVDSYIEEAGGVQRIERISAVRAGTLTDVAWWKNERKGKSLAKLRKKYDDMVANAQLN
jgi:hypothetical protein